MCLLFERINPPQTRQPTSHTPCSRSSWSHVLEKSREIESNKIDIELAIENQVGQSSHFLWPFIFWTHISPSLPIWSNGPVLLKLLPFLSYLLPPIRLQMSESAFIDQDLRFQIQAETLPKPCFSFLSVSLERSLEITVLFFDLENSKSNMMIMA